MEDWKEAARNGRHVRRNLIDDEELIPSKRRRKKKPKPRRSQCKALECLICTLRFSIEDILNGVYNLETFICSYCYAEMQNKPHEQSCFGKPTFIQIDGTQDHGYDPEDKECRDLCPDRVICHRIVNPDQ